MLDPMTTGHPFPPAGGPSGQLGGAGSAGPGRQTPQPTRRTVGGRIDALRADAMVICRERFAAAKQRARSGRHLPSVLLLHDRDGWAIDHVFRLWFPAPGENIRFSRWNWGQVATGRALKPFDLVVFGFFDMLLKYDYDPAKSVVVIHDPSEIFPQEPGWRSSPPLSGRIERLRSLRGVITISLELEKILTASGIACLRIPTTTRLPLRDPSELVPLAPRAVSVFHDYPRKNAGLLERLQGRGRASGRWDLSLKRSGYLSADDYIAFLDQFPIYVCASWQEGGPLPAFDAMARGAVVVSTPVGQLPEVVEHGVSGFFCEDVAEFEAALSRLGAEPDSLLAARRAALSALMRQRDPGAVSWQAQETLLAIIGNAARS